MDVLLRSNLTNTLCWNKSCPPTARPPVACQSKNLNAAYIGRLKYLGYGFHMRDGKCHLRLHEKSEAKLRRKLWADYFAESWRIAGSWKLSRAIGDEALRKAGYSWIGRYYSASALPKGSCRSKRP